MFMRNDKLFAIVVMLGMLIGCSGSPPQQNPAWKLVPITDVNMVVGEWEGTFKHERALFPEGSVRLAVHDDSTYRFVAESTSTTVAGSGPLQIQEGRLVGKTDPRVVTLELYDVNGKAVLVVDSINRESGDRHHGEFTKKTGHIDRSAKPKS
jgi:hypothetical protein